MPVIHVEMWPGRTYAQKKQLAKAITDAMVNIAKTTPEATIVIFSDVPGRAGLKAAYFRPKPKRVSPDSPQTPDAILPDEGCYFLYRRLSFVPAGRSVSMLANRSFRGV